MISSNLITYNGVTQSIKDWAKMLGIADSTLRSRFHYYGWSLEDILTLKPHEKKIHSSPKLFTYNGKTQSIYAWAKEMGIDYQCLRSRLTKANWLIEKALLCKSNRDVASMGAEISLNSSPEFECATAYDVFCNSQKVGTVYKVRVCRWRHTHSWESWRSRHEAIANLIQKI